VEKSYFQTIGHANANHLIVLVSFEVFLFTPIWIVGLIYVTVIAYGF